MESGIEDDELEAGRGDHLHRVHRILHLLRPDPEEPPEVDAVGLGDLRVEVITEVDEHRRFPGARRGGEGGEDDGEASGGTASGELDDLAARQPAAEERVERLEGGGEKLVAALLAERADQLRRAHDFGADGGFQTFAQAANVFPFARFYRR
jgi:hypothetical protein